MAACMRTNAHTAGGSVFSQEQTPEMGSTGYLSWRSGGALSALSLLRKVCLPGKCVFGGPEDVDDLLPEVRYNLQMLLSISSIHTLAMLSCTSSSQLASSPWYPERCVRQRARLATIEPFPGTLIIDLQ